MRNLLIFILLFISQQSFAATWYVRPINDCSGAACGVNDGSSYAAAYNGFADITWGGGGVSAGDTLKVCGSFTDASSSIAGTRMFSVAGSGSAGNIIVIDGNCASSGSLATAILDGGGAVDHGIRTLANTYLTFRNITVQNFDSRGFVLYNDASTDITIDKFITLESTITVKGIRNAGATADGIDARGQDITLDGVTVSDIGEDAIYIKGARAIVRNATVVYPSQDGVLGDCLQFNTEITGTSITNFYCDHRNKDSKQCLVANGFTDTPTYSVNGLTCLMPAGATTAIGVLLEGTNVYANRIFVSGGNYGINQQDVAGSTVTLRGSVVKGTTTACVSTGNNPTNYLVQNNTLVDCGGTGINFGAATNTRVAQNNIIQGSFSRGINKGSSGTTESYNNIFGPTTAVLSNGTGTSAGPGTITTDPKMFGGPLLSTNTSGYKLKSESGAKRTGISLNAGAIQDIGNRTFTNPPSIGAWEADEVLNRTTRN